MSQVITIAMASIKENSRRRLLLVFGILSLLVTIGLIVIGLRKEDAEVLFGPTDIGSTVALGMLSILALIAAMAVSMNAIGPAFASGEASLILSRPVTRAQYALGRVLGSAILVVGFTAIVALETQLIRVVTGAGMSTLLWSHWLVEAFNLLVVSAVTVLFSCFFSIPVISAVFAFVFFQVNQGIFVGHALVESGFLKGPLATIVEVLWYISPKLLQSDLQIQQQSAGGAEVPFAPIPATFGLTMWAIGWLIAIVGATVWVTKRKQI